jgi:hypothetical protein
MMCRSPDLGGDRAKSLSSGVDLNKGWAGTHGQGKPLPDRCNTVCAVASGTRCWGKKSAQERRAPVAPCALGRLVPVFASPRQGSEARAERMVEEVHTATACVALRCSALLCVALRLSSHSPALHCQGPRRNLVQRPLNKPLRKMVELAYGDHRCSDAS